MHKSVKSKYVLKYTKPTALNSAWEGALPLGNSNVGALVQGGARTERIMLSRSDAVYGGLVGVLPDVSDKLKEVRRLVAANNQVMAGMTFEKALEAKKFSPTVDMPLPIADIVISHTNVGKISLYNKSLAMDQAEVGVSFSASGLKIERNCFVSYADDMVYYEISKSGAGLIDVEIELVAHDKSRMVYNSNLAALPDAEVRDVSSNFLVYETQRGTKAFGVVLRVAVDNKAVIDVQANKLRLTGAEKIVIIAKTYVGKVKDKLFDKVRSELAAIKQISYEKAFSLHIDKYLKVWGKAELSLNGNKDVSVNDVLDAGVGGECSAIMEKLFHFAKYLNIVAVDSKFKTPFKTSLFDTYYGNTDAALDMSLSLPALYSLGFMFGTPSKFEGVIDYFQKYQDDLKKNANRLYKAQGFMVPNSFVVGSLLPARIDAKNLSTITSGAVIANLYYEYFLYTKDIKFLNSVALPFMMKVADFYMSYFFKDEKGELKSVPSFSPLAKSKYFEYKDVSVYDSATADFVVAKSLVKKIIDISNIYSLPVSKILDYQKFYNELSSFKFEEDGEIKEFAFDANSHISSGVLHLFDVFGTRDVNFLSSAEKQRLYVGSLKSRAGAGLYSQNIISLARLLDIAATLGQKDIFAGVLDFILNNYLSENLMFLSRDKYSLCSGGDKESYFNIPVNMLVVSSFVKSIIQDDENNLYILPAKSAEFETGALSGIYTKNSTIVDISFDDKRGNMQVSVKALKGTTFNLVLFKGVKKVKGYTIDTNNPVISGIKLAASKTIQFDIKY